MAAIEKHWVCNLTYQSVSKKAPTQRLFAPARMISMNQALYVMGATIEEDYKTVRHFITIAVHRVKELSLTDRFHNIEFPALEEGVFGLPWHEPKPYRLHFNAGGSAAYVKERIWSDDQEIETCPDGSIVLTLTSQSEPELKSWVNSFGGEAKILEENIK